MREINKTALFLQPQLARLNRYGVLMLSILDYETIARGDAVVPLFLGRVEGNPCNISLSILRDEQGDAVDIRTIRHIEDSATGEITVDWEESGAFLTHADTVRQAVERAGGCIHSEEVVGYHRLYVCGNEPARPYMGPRSIKS